MWVNSFAIFSFSGQVYTVCGSVSQMAADFRLAFGNFAANLWIDFRPVSAFSAFFLVFPALFVIFSVFSKIFS